MFSCVWLHFKKCFGKYFLMFGCVLENTIKNTFSTCCSYFFTFSQLPNEYIISFIPKNTNKTQKRSHFLDEIAIAIMIEIGAISNGEIEISEIAIAISPISREASIAIAIDASCDRNLAIEIGKIAIAISPIEIMPISIAITITISLRKCNLFWFLFVFLGMNDIMYSFGN